jgi:Mn2+/Fe2+ NRAMP family transporter
MLVFTFVFLVSAILVLMVKKPARPPNGSPEYRWDDRVVASVLVIMAAAFAVLQWLG